MEIDIQWRLTSPGRFHQGRNPLQADDLDSVPIRQNGSRTLYVITYSGTLMTVVSKTFESSRKEPSEYFDI